MTEEGSAARKGLKLSDVSPPRHPVTPTRRHRLLHLEEPRAALGTRAAFPNFMNWPVVMIICLIRRQDAVIDHFRLGVDCRAGHLHQSSSKHFPRDLVIGAKAKKIRVSRAGDD